MRKFKAEVFEIGGHGYMVEIWHGVSGSHLAIYPQKGRYFDSKKSAKRAANRIAGKLGYELEWVN